MTKQMMDMEALEQVNGGNVFVDAWGWICNQLDKMDMLDRYKYQPQDWPVAESDGNC